MKYEDGLTQLLDFASSNDGTASPTDNGVIAQLSVATKGEVHLVLWFTLWRDSANRPAWIKSHLTFFSRRLSTTPIDEDLLSSLQGVPKQQVQAILSFRKSSNGHVPYVSTDMQQFAQVGPLSRLTHEQLGEYLSRTLAGTHELAAGTEWPSKVEDFLPWVRIRIASVPGLAMLTRQSQSWVVQREA